MQTKHLLALTNSCPPTNSTQTKYCTLYTHRHGQLQQTHRSARPTPQSLLSWSATEVELAPSSPLVSWPKENLKKNHKHSQTLRSKSYNVLRSYQFYPNKLLHIVHKGAWATATNRPLRPAHTPSLLSWPATDVELAPSSLVVSWPGQNLKNHQILRMLLFSALLSFQLLYYHLFYSPLATLLWAIPLWALSYSTFSYSTLFTVPFLTGIISYNFYWFFNLLDSEVSQNNLLPSHECNAASIHSNSKYVNSGLRSPFSFNHRCGVDNSSYMKTWVCNICDQRNKV